MAPRAKKKGSTIKGGRVISFTVYPQAKMKAIIVEAAREADRSVSNFMLHETLKNIAKDRKTTLDELLPEVEYESVVNQKQPREKK